ncbi:MAG: ABC transporter permease [Chloroflexi bacterium]|nr:MAG: ABC transporter permease [Chloroflexota bacterium]
MQPKRSTLPFWSQVVDLFLIELTNWRWSWRSIMLFTIIAPLLTMLGLSVFAKDSGLAALNYVLTGNVVLALMFGPMEKVQSHFLFMRTMGTLNYFATLPIRKQALVLAVLSAFFFMTLPSVIITIFVGSWLLGVPLTISPYIALVLPICTLPLAGIGAMIGTSANTPAEGSTINTMFTLIMLGLGPVIIPPERLPDWLVMVGKISPATYAASAMRQTLLGPVTIQLATDLGILVLMGLLTFWIAGRKMDWRQK